MSTLRKRKSKYKKKGRTMSMRQKKAFKILAEKGGSIGAAMREAGYSEISSLTPAKLTGSKAFVAALDKVGLTDEYIAKGYREFTKAAELREYTFEAKIVTEVIDIDEDDPRYKKGKVNKQEVTHRVQVSDKKIKDTIARIPGAELIYIADHYDKRIAYFSKPDFVARKTGYEFSSKVRNHFAPEQVNHIIEHTMSPEEQEKYNDIMGKNKK